MAERRICAVETCGKPVMCKGWCRSHYYKLRQTPGCKVDGCNQPQIAFGFCQSHAQRYRRHGDPLAGAKTPGTLFKWIVEHAGYSGDDCLRWPFATSPAGYGQIERLGRQTTAHRVMCREAHGEPPTPKHDAAHNCGNGHLGCINPKHLRWATRQENTDDRMLVHDTHFYAVGELHGQAKITEADVIEIRRRKAAGESSRAVGVDFGLCRQSVDSISNRKNWSHVE